MAKQAPAENSFQAVNQISWIKGQHTIKAGGEYRPQQYNDYIFPSFGTYNFTNRFSGYSYSDFLLGLPNTTSRVYVRPPQSARFWNLAGFIQDDFKVSPRLTLSYGLRYEFDRPGVDTHDTIANFDPVSGSIVVPNENRPAREHQSAVPGRYSHHHGGAGRDARTVAAPWRPNNLQPRFGFALRPSRIPRQ